jgi:hypothetical protein
MMDSRMRERGTGYVAKEDEDSLYQVRVVSYHMQLVSRMFLRNAGLTQLSSR